MVGSCGEGNEILCSVRTENTDNGITILIQRENTNVCVYVGGGGRSTLRFSDVPLYGIKETSGQKRKYESTGKIEGTEDFLSFDTCKKEKMLNEREGKKK